MSKIKIFSLGGQNEDGKNLYIVDVDEDIFVFDAGLKNADDRMLGIDYIIPNFDYLKENIKRIKGVFITHGHDEHYGALADIVQEIPQLPVYATEFTADMIKNDLANNNIKLDNLTIIKPHRRIEFGQNSIFPISLTHSVPDTVGYVLNTPDGAIVYTGNFVFDSTMQGSYYTDIGKLAYIGKQGVLCLMTESLYAEKVGWTSPNHRIADIINSTLHNVTGRILFNVFQAELYRIQELFDELIKTNRQVVIVGKKLEMIIKQAIDKKYIDFDKKRIGTINDVNQPGIVLLISDEKEKPYSNINRIVSGFDKFIKLQEDDTVLFAAPIYDGLEKRATKIFDEIAKIGANLIVTSEKDAKEHHASSEDLMLMLNLMKPKYYLPVIGEFRSMTAAKEVAKQVGMVEEDIILKLNGQVTYFENGEYNENYAKVKIDDILIDGKTVGDVGELVIKDRELLSENGVIVVNVTLERLAKKIVEGPIISSKGFVFSKKKDLEEATKISKEVILELQKPNYIDYNKIKNEIRSRLGKFLFKKTDSKPMILIIIQEV